MGFKKFNHVTPQLQKIKDELQKSDANKFKDLELLLEHTFAEPGSVESNSEDPSDKEQEVDLDFKIDFGHKKKPAKKKQKTEEEKPAAVYFNYTSKWHYDCGHHSYKANLKLTDAEGKDLKEILTFKSTKAMEVRAESQMDIDWDVIDEIKKTLKTSVDSAHLLEIMRCSLYCRKSTRLVPDKWDLPTTRPEPGGKQTIEDCAAIGRKTVNPLPSAKDYYKDD